MESLLSIQDTTSHHFDTTGYSPSISPCTHGDYDFWMCARFFRSMVADRFSCYGASPVCMIGRNTVPPSTSTLKDERKSYEYRQLDREKSGWRGIWQHSKID